MKSLYYTDHVSGDVGLTGEVNPIVLNGLNVKATQHDFLSKKSTNYEKTPEVVHLHNDDFVMDKALEIGL